MNKKIVQIVAGFLALVMIIGAFSIVLFII